MIDIHQIDLELVINASRAIVHHGESYIAGLVVEKGKMSLTCPFLPEHYFWARQLKTLGLGFQQPFGHVTEESLTRLLEQLLAWDNKEKITRYSKILKREDGLEQVASIIASQLMPVIFDVR